VMVEGAERIIDNPGQTAVQANQTAQNIFA
jgi:hypothetical protein